MNKSELKRKCVMNPMDMAQEIIRLSGLCEAKDQKITLLSGVFSREEELKAQLSEAHAQIAMQADILIKIRSHDERAIIQKLIRNALSATSETVAAWRAKETEPLRKEVAMLRDAITFALVDIEGDAWIGILKQAVEDTQATALAYEREVENRGAVKALEEAKMNIKSVADDYDNKTDYGEGRIDSVDYSLDAIEELLRAVTMEK